MNRLADFLPAPRDEAFKYTSLAALARRDYAAPAPTDFDRGTLPEQLGARILFIDGVFAMRGSDAMHREQGIASTRLAVLGSDAMHRECRGDEALRVMNAALATECLSIEVPKGTDAGVIELLFASTEHDGRIAAHPQVRVTVGRGAKLTLIERHVGPDSVQDFINLVTELDIADSAEVNHLVSQQAGSKMTVTSGVFATLAAGARFDSHAVQLGGQLVRADIGVTLAGRDARCTLNGFHLPGKMQHIDTHTTITHAVADTVSEEHYRAVVDRGGRSVFNGKVVVAKGADRSDAQQYNANLLLSEQAEADTKPELEIHADDVKCAHGATVGRVDETALFYLRSRGISAEAARSVLIWAFAEAILTALPHEKLRSVTEDAVLARLPDSDLIKEFR